MAFGGGAGDDRTFSAGGTRGTGGAGTGSGGGGMMSPGGAWNADNMVSVPDRLAKLGDIYRERNATYGDTYKNFGKVMRGFFPRPITLDSEEEWNRMALFFHCADKLARTAAALPGGVHVDSLDDNSVYSQMLQEYDAIVKAEQDNV